MSVSMIASVWAGPIAGGGVCVACALCVRGKGRLWVAVLCAACAAYAGGTVRSIEREREAAGRLLLTRARVEGRVAGFPRASRFGTSFPFDTIVAGTRLRVRVRATRFDVGAGETLALEGRWRPARPSVGGRAFFKAASARRLLGRDRAGVSRWLWSAHRRARTALSRRLGSNSALPLALLLGERGFLSTRQRKAFVRLGISHLFALSGLHLGLIAALAMVATRGWGRWRDASVAATLVGYVLVVGAIHSLYRALAMVLLMLASRQLTRPVAPLHTLGTALVILLLMNPEALRSAGFQLSFAATFAVLFALPRVSPSAAQWRRRRWPGRLLAGAHTTVALGAAVTVFVAPIQLHHFGVVSTVGPLATVAFAPVVALLLVWSLACALCDGIGPIGDWLGEGLSAATRAAGQAIDWCARHAPAATELPPPNPALYYAGLTLAATTTRGGWRAVGVLLVVGSFLIRG